ncbi:MAG TPA: hypothetical protein V6C52_14755 [Coleofasciculaceae cyanobacterium]|jgi:hypothetical protein
MSLRSLVAVFILVSGLCFFAGCQAKKEVISIDPIFDAPGKPDTAGSWVSVMTDGVTRYEIQNLGKDEKDRVTYWLQATCPEDGCEIVNSDGSVQKHLFEGRPVTIKQQLFKADCKSEKLSMPFVWNYLYATNEEAYVQDYRTQLKQLDKQAINYVAKGGEDTKLLESSLLGLKDVKAADSVSQEAFKAACK